MKTNPTEKRRRGSKNDEAKAETTTDNPKGHFQRPSETFKEEIMKYYSELLVYAKKLCNTENDAEDILHDTYLKVLQKEHLFQKGTNLRAWLYSILRNQYINWYRRRKKYLEIINQEMMFSDKTYKEVDKEFLMQEKADALSEEIVIALSEVPEKNRIPFLLRHFDNCSYKEICKILKIPENIARQRVFKARKQLKTSLRRLSNN